MTLTPGTRLGAYEILDLLGAGGMGEGYAARDTEFLVVAPLEGETLAARLSRGPLPIPELLKTGVEIADALDRAHRQGLVHRDLKPGNIMLTKSGAKLLDFGLARDFVSMMFPGL